MLDPDVGGEGLEPGGEHLHRRMGSESLIDGVDQVLHVVPVDGWDQVLAGQEVPVQRPCAPKGYSATMTIVASKHPI
jgi:hypothetical protein